MEISRIEEALRILRSPGRSWSDKSDEFRQLPELLQAMKPEVEYVSVYEPIVMNLLYLRRGLGIDRERARALAAECVRSRLLQEAEFYWRIASLRERGGGEQWLKPSLVLPRGGPGAVVYSFRFGMMRHLIIDLVLSGYSVCHVLNRDLAGFASWIPSVLKECLPRREGQRLFIIDVDTRGAAAEIFRALRSGVIVFLAGEGRPKRRTGVRKRNVIIDLLESKVTTDGGLLQMARAAGANVNVVTAIREGTGSRVLHRGPIVECSSDRNAVSSPGAVMQELYNFFEPFILKYTDQWEGITGLHRLVPKEEPAPKKAPVGGEINASILRRSAKCYVTVARDEGAYCVHVDTMRAFQIDGELERITRAVVELNQGDGVTALLDAVDARTRAAHLLWLGKLAAHGVLEM